MASNTGTPCSAKGVVEMWMDHFALELVLSVQTPGQLLPVLGLFPSLDWDLGYHPRSSASLFWSVGRTLYSHVEFREKVNLLVTKSCPTLMTSWTVAFQVPLSMWFPRQEYWNGLPFPSPGDLPDPGIKPASPALAGRFFTTEPPGKSHW